MICYACQNGTLEQKHADTIEGPSCGAKWKNYSLGYGNSGYQSKTYRRSQWSKGSKT